MSKVPTATDAAAERDIAPAEWGELIWPSGATSVDVHAQLTQFVREAVRAGDCYVDTDPDHGAAVVAAEGGAQVVLQYRGHARDVVLPDVSAELHAASRSGGAPAARVIAGATTIDSCVGDALRGDGLVHVFAGDAAQVAALLANARGLVRAGRLGTVAWRHEVPQSGARNRTTTALAALSRGGFSHYALITGADGAELVRADEASLPPLVFSLSDAFLARAGAEPPPVAESIDLRVHASVLYDAITEDLTPGAQALGRVPTRSELAQVQLELAWPHAQVVSFDIFDTLVVRNAASPTDVFLHLGAHAPFADLGVSPDVLRTAREAAESEARRSAYAKFGSAEASLPEIHAHLAAALGLSEQDVPAMVRAEQNVELALCTAHPTLKVWFERAARDGKAVWCLSDTYHDATFLNALLEHCGYSLTDVTVVSSADRRCSKGEGRLFRTVLPVMGVDAAQVLHIGDNAASDHDVPAGIGISAVLHPWAAYRSTDTPALSTGDSVALGLAMIGARTAEPPQAFWWRFGYSVGGPLLAGFALWLNEQFAADGIDRAYFLLRDGEVLHEVYQAVVGSASGVQTGLLESSRRAFSLPALEAGLPTLRPQLTASENPRPVREFLERLGVNAEPFKALCLETGLTSLDEVVHPGDRPSMQRVANLMQHKAVAAALRERSRHERALMLEYLRAEGVLKTGRVALVDVGWNGTIQKSLAAVLTLAKRPYAVHGYYLGTNPSAHVDIGASQVSGYLFECGHPVHRMRAVMALPQLVEFICTTTRGSLRRFARENGRVTPVHGTVDHDAAQIERQQQLRRGVMAYAAQFAGAKQALNLHQISAEAALQRLARVIASPTSEEAQQIGDITHGDGLGAERSRKLAAFSPGHWTLDSIHRDRMTSYWPAGLAARRDPQALVLRAVNWLFDDAQE